jgi:putative oxidoreductase
MPATHAMREWREMDLSLNAVPGESCPRSIIRYIGRYERACYAVFRVALGGILLMHGAPKALCTSHGLTPCSAVDSTSLIANVVSSAAVPTLTYAVLLVEVVGALLLAMGWAARMIAMTVAVEMIGVCYVVGPMWSLSGRESGYPLFTLALAIYVAARGGAQYSPDAALGRYLWRTMSSRRSSAIAAIAPRINALHVWHG